MTRPPLSELEALWTAHNAAWRDPAQVASQWEGAAATAPRLLRHTVRGAWWDVLGACGITLLVTREYEHLAMALHAAGREPAVSFMPMPHPSGVAVDRVRGTVHVATGSDLTLLEELSLRDPTSWLLAGHTIFATERLPHYVEQAARQGLSLAGRRLLTIELAVRSVSQAAQMPDNPTAGK